MKCSVNRRVVSDLFSSATGSKPRIWLLRHQLNVALRQAPTSGELIIE